MNILVLGGTQFSGRAFVEQATDTGHQITLLHRSKEDPGLPKSVRRLVGDRDPKEGNGLDEIKALLDAGERFDAVVDMCAYVPRVMRASCELLKDAADLYLFTSTISVYPRFGNTESPDETSDTIVLDDPAVEEVTGETYGGLKVLCEQVVHEFFPNNHCIVRPGVIAGPNDPTDRVTWWARMLGTIDQLVIPTEPCGLAGFIDARDLAAFFLRCIEQGTTGTFNAVGPEPDLPLRSFIQRTHTALGSKTTLIDAHPDRLAELGVSPWTDIPTWIPEDGQSMYHISCQRAMDAGLKLRPLEETMHAIRDWDVARGQPELKVGLSPERIADLIAKL